MKNAILPDKIRYRYRKFILLWIPVRVYVLQTTLSAHEIRQKLFAAIHPFRLYFLFSPATDKPYTGKFGMSGFTAVKNNPGSRHRPLKILGTFYSVDGKIYLRLIFSNPFSIVNIALLGLLYLVLLAFRFKPFPGITANLVFYLIPALFTYLLTNFSFQRIYKKEKAFFFHLFKARRLKDDEIERLGI
jgi:hypothetical protein